MLEYLYSDKIIPRMWLKLAILTLGTWQLLEQLQNLPAPSWYSPAACCLICNCVHAYSSSMLWQINCHHHITLVLSPQGNVHCITYICWDLHLVFCLTLVFSSCHYSSSLSLFSCSLIIPTCLLLVIRFSSAVVHPLFLCLYKYCSHLPISHWFIVWITQIISWSPCRHEFM